MWTPLSSASDFTLWDWRPMSLVTAISVDRELGIYSKRVERQFSETGLSLQEEQWPCF